jgi:hypothetical protein
MRPEIPEIIPCLLSLLRLLKNAASKDPVEKSVINMI